MEQQEEKRKIKAYQRKSKRSKSGSSSIPLDLVSEILLRLPEKSVARFRCVSKPWSSITTEPYFINLLTTRSPRLLLCFKANEKFFVSSIPQHRQTFETWNKSHSYSQLIDRYHMEFSEEMNYFPPSESVNGLICFQESARLIVWNPSTRQLLILPKPNGNSNDLTIFLGYDPVEGKHKVMCMEFSATYDTCRVLTLGSAQKLWRTVKTHNKHRSDYYDSGRCINGVVYHIAYVKDMCVWVLMSFDVRSEIFDMIELPSSDVHKDVLIDYNGRLACVGREIIEKNGIRLWILEKHNKWSSKDFLAPLVHIYKSLSTNKFLLKGFTHAGEIIYVESMFHKSAKIFFYDPVRNTSRRFELKGFTDDEFVLSNEHGYTVHVFPNHVESQISFT
ncbi:F-box associated interaction domain [Arabidopsis thaliana x Arabidopsis arenosa]|uniref:F-box domain-containing protein n=2 Tax=Arabidopsis TaxID=3701 RepID=A0A178VHI9_ARATH|nr:F-box associated interaction domain [Arabidopsis thaliana x Arabidopsis arenosa]OAP04362.1 hypothetical protein AXX17_AT3G10020 [Arabidopsis thaliana]